MAQRKVRKRRAEILELYKDDSTLTAQQVAEILDISISTAYRDLSILGITSDDEVSTTIDRTQLLKLYYQGIPTSVIAEMIGCHISSIYVALKAEGLPTKRDRSSSVAVTVYTLANDLGLESIDNLASLRIALRAIRGQITTIANQITCFPTPVCIVINGKNRIVNASMKIDGHEDFIGHIDKLIGAIAHIDKSTITRTILDEVYALTRYIKTVYFYGDSFAVGTEEEARVLFETLYGVVDTMIEISAMLDKAKSIILDSMGYKYEDNTV